MLKVLVVICLVGSTFVMPATSLGITSESVSVSYKISVTIPVSAFSYNVNIRSDPKTSFKEFETQLIQEQLVFRNNKPVLIRSFAVL